MATVGSSEVSLEVFVAQFVPVLVFPVSFGSLLDGVIGEMDECVVKIVKAKGLAGCADVPFIIPISLDNTVVDCHKHVGSDVKLPPVVQKGVYDVVLEYVCLALLSAGGL